MLYCVKSVIVNLIVDGLLFELDEAILTRDGGIHLLKA